MFFISKLLSFVTQPLAWVVLVLLLGLLTRPHRRRTGLALGWVALTLLLVQGWEPLPDSLLRPLEARYPERAEQASVQGFAGVVVLGGALESAYVWQGHAQPALNDAAERMTEALRLVQRSPQLQLLFTGGEGEFLGQSMTEADRAKIFFDRMGLVPQRVRFESASRTTYENAILSARIPGIDPSQPWLLLTSAFHMPRAMATFQKAGWNVTAYPVDFRAGQHTPWDQYSLAAGAHKWQTALHEWLGWLVYRWAGRA